MREANFNGVALAELSVNFVENPAKVIGKGAFINTSTGQTHGYTTCHQWAADTMNKLRELRALMERDLAVVHFTDAADGSSGSSTTGSSDPRAGFKGLGEHFGDGVPPA